MHCSLGWLRSITRLPRLSLVASYLLFASAAIWIPPSLACAKEEDQETESPETGSNPAAITEKDAAQPTPPEAKPPIGLPAYGQAPACNAPGYYGQQPYGCPSYGPMPYGPPVAGPSYFGPSPFSLQLQRPNAGAMYDTRQFPAMPYQVFQPEPRACGQIGCPSCRMAYRTGAGNAMIADSSAPTLKLRPGEAAQVILELIDQVGPSVLDGTLYAQPVADGDLSCMARPRGVMQGSPREALVHWIRRAEAERDRQRTELEAVDEPTAPVQDPQVDGRQMDLVEALRTVGEQLDDAANLLDRQNLFFRADQLRELATQLRQESRSAQGGWSLQPLRSPSAERPPHPEQDLKLEVEQLQQELRQALKALERKNEEPRR